MMENSKTWFRVQGDWNHHRSAEQVKCSEFHGIAVLGREQKKCEVLSSRKQIGSPAYIPFEGTDFSKLILAPKSMLVLGRVLNPDRTLST